MPNDELLLKFSIPGRPSTKKTSQRVVRRGGFTKILPSLLYEKYEKHCKEYCEDAWKNHGMPAIDCGVAVKLKVFLDSWIVGDECGYQQAHGDIIQAHSVIQDDMWIHWIDKNEHMIFYDKENPRIEVEIYRYKLLIKKPLERVVFLVSNQWKEFFISDDANIFRHINRNIPQFCK